MSKDKKKNTGMDLGGDIGEAVFELLNILVTKLIELLSFILIWLVNKGVDQIRGPRVKPLKTVTRKELQNTKSTEKIDALGYSVTQKKEMNLSELDKRRHTMVCGASGFGKTVLLDNLMLGDMIENKPVIFIDPKGDNRSLKQFINLCRVNRSEFQIFSEHYDGYGSVSLNPAKEGSFTHIADRIHQSFHWSEEHYEMLCYRALKRACKIIKKNNRVCSFGSIFNTLNHISDPQNKKKEFDRKNIEGIITRLENVVRSDFGEKLKEEGLSLKEVWQSRKCLYIGLPVLGYPKIARSLGKLIMGDLAYSIYDAYREMGIDDKGFWPVAVYIDELSAIITDEFIELLNKCRGAKVELNFAFQSPSDINKVSPYLCEQILENSSNWFIFKQRVEAGAGLFAEAIGTTESTKETLRVVEGQIQDQGSQRKVEELLAHHNIIKNLNVGQAILLRHAPSQIDLIRVKHFSPEIAENRARLMERDGWIEPIPLYERKNDPCQDEALN